MASATKFAPLPTQTLTLPHPTGTGTIRASFALSSLLGVPDANKPTLVLVNSMTTDASLFSPQFADPRLANNFNLLAIELLGHGGTRVEGGVADGGFGSVVATGGEGLKGDGGAPRDHWTYWDSAAMNVAVMEKLGIERAFVAGTSQGGWVAVRMALLAPEKVLGLIPMGTSMDAETQRTRALGCWDGAAAAAGPIAFGTSATPTPDFVPPEAYCDFLIDVGLGKDCDAEARAFWVRRVQDNYRGDAGRKRIRMAAINLAERDGLHARLPDVRCPVLWMHGTEDEVFTVANAREEIELFVGAREKELVVVEGGYHFLSASSADEVNARIAEFVKRHWKPPVPEVPGTPDVAARAVAE